MCPVLGLEEAVFRSKLTVMLILAATALGTHPAAARVIDVGRIAPEDLKRQCQEAKGKFISGNDRAYSCEFPGGVTISCNRQRFCVKTTRTTGFEPGGANDAGILQSR